MHEQLGDLEPHKSRTSRFLGNFFLRPHIFLLFLFVVMVMILGMVVMIVYRKSKKTKHNNSSQRYIQQDSDISKWKTFQGEGFSFKYPSSLSIEVIKSTTSPGGISGYNFSFGETSKPIDDNMLKQEEYSSQSSSPFVLDLETNNGIFLLNAFPVKGTCYANENSPYPFQNVKISSKEGVKILQCDYRLDQQNPSYDQKIVQFQLKDHVYGLEFNLQNQRILPQIDKIISSLQFSKIKVPVFESLPKLISQDTPPPVTPSSLDIAWKSEPKKIPSNGFFALYDKAQPWSITYSDPNSSDSQKGITMNVPLEPHATYYQIGTVKSGGYKNGTVYMGIISNLPQTSTVQKGGFPSLQDFKYDKTIAIPFIKTTDGHYVIPSDYNFAGEYSTKSEKTLSKDIGRRYDKSLDFMSDFDEFRYIDKNNFVTTISTPKYPGDLDTVFSSRGLFKVVSLDQNHSLWISQNFTSKTIRYADILEPIYEIRLPSGLSQQANIYTTGGPEDGESTQFHITPPNAHDEIGRDVMYWNKTDLPEAYTKELSQHQNQSSIYHPSYSYQSWQPCSYNFMSTILTDNQYLNTRELKQVATTDNGDTFYVITDPNNPLEQTLYQHLTDTTAYQSNKYMDYQTFLSYDPVIIWKNPLGVYTALFINSKNLNTNGLFEMSCYAEPLIYLYPSEQTHFTVKLDKSINLTASLPEYRNGWSGMAYPNGQIKLDTNNLKSYPFLFWEGGATHPQNEIDSDMVKQSDIHNYLNKELTRLGLNAAETKDFENYWKNKLKSSPYYKLTFYGTDSLNAVIPLSINPKPDTTIRVLMDYWPLSKPEGKNIYDPNFITPKRTGFTVVELGGILH